ncbi:MAG: hypothetical protein Q4D55_00120 [Eubacteriales bacterium]|nr:hypothetical protein [Eubacteriales bacterium]
MAKTTNRPATSRRSRGSTRGVYVEGNTVRKVQVEPRRQARPAPPKVQRAKPRPASQKAVQAGRTVSKEAQKNREKAMNMNKGFVVFIAVVSLAVLYCCIHYLQLKSEYTSQIGTVAARESELAQLREYNDAYYSQVNSSVDLDQIRKIAIGRLGMKYPSEDQVMTYTTEGGSYVRQYQNIPDSK